MTILDTTTLSVMDNLLANVTVPADVPHLRSCVERAVENYFTQLEDACPTNLFNMVMSEVEEPLLRTVMKVANGNQSKAAQWLGLSRGTLRKKLEQYDLL